AGGAGWIHRQPGLVCLARPQPLAQHAIISRMHDAVIIRAGPGGASTARFLSRRGLDVLLLDRADFPRDKTCGDGLTPRALRVLDQMGILPEVERAGCRVGAYEVVAPNG